MCMVDAKTEFECTWNFLVWIGNTGFQNLQGGNKMKSEPMKEIIENLPHIPHHLTPFPDISALMMLLNILVV